MRRLLRSPLLRCFALGGVLWLGVQAAAALGWLSAEAPVVTLTEADLRDARAQVVLQSGLPATPVTLRAALRRRADERILLEEALRLGLHRRDAVVRRRLIDNMRLIYGERAPGQARLLREAEMLGMPREDLLIRRRLVEHMQRRIAGHHAPPDDDTLAEFVARYADRFGDGPALSFEHRWFGGEDARARAAEAAQRLARGESVDGDPWLLGTRFTRLRRRDLQRLFDPGFADAVMGLSAGEWRGPLRGARGWHAVRVSERHDGTVPALEAVRQRAAYAWNEAQREGRIEAGMERLRTRYQVQMDVRP